LTINWKPLYSFQREVKILGGVLLKEYFKNLVKVASRGDAREESFYETLKDILVEYTSSVLGKKFHVTTLPKQTEAGNPDFRIWDGKQHIVGYIEAKAPEVDDLDRIAHSEQLKRYFHTFPNLILTNFFEFRLYRDGNLIEKVLTGRPYVMTDLGKVPPVENEKEFLLLLEKFFSFSLPKVYDAKKLAVELAKRTRFLRDEVIAEELREEESKGEGNILGFFEAFKDYLIKGLTKEDFADLYSQTITYGLFAARTRSEKEFSRKHAYDNIPHTIGILKDVFEYISLGDIPESMEWIVDDISEVLAVTDVKSILHKYFHEGKGRDPIIHFYETFLSEYDPKTREKRGVYYTPEPVVSFIVRSLNQILKEYFNKPEGFAAEGITVLDPAAGTLTFIAEAAKLAIEEFVTKYGKGGKEGFIRDHILENFYAFELMMAPYAIGHLKMSFLLEELGYKLKEDDRFKLYLTNTLEMEELPETKLPGMVSLSKESHLAGKVKREQPILVILGNPPYSGHSANISEWIDNLLKEGYERVDGSKDDGYYKVDGNPLGEKNPKWLQDDYVKFIRFAQWKIDQMGEGVLGLITNHGYLDNPTFRGMRESLMKSFDEIYVLNLHGNSLKKEISPDGKKDENVFDIRQGVSITLFINEGKKNRKCRVRHAEVWGLREKKYIWLLKNDIKSTDWKEIKPKSKFYFYVPRDTSLLEKYNKHLKITEIFPLNGVGMTTSRDDFVIDTDKNRLLNRIRLFKNSKLSDDALRESFNIRKKKGWSIRKAWNKLQSISDSCLEDYIEPVLYRPFDVRRIFYHDSIVWRTAKRVMLHMTQENLGLITNRQVRTEGIKHTFVCNKPIDLHILETANANPYLFPLYTYPYLNKNDLFSQTKRVEEKESNINSNLCKILYKTYKNELTPEEIFYYIYGVLYSNIYRKKYEEFLKRDFPKIPFTKDYELFIEIGKLGRRLVDLHLLKSNELETSIARFQGEGDNRIAKAKKASRNYNPKEKRVYINKDKQYFEGIEKEIWEYYIGGYQVLDTWLKYRQERKLSTDDIKHFCKMVTVISKTIGIQKEIDEIYPEIEKDVVGFGK